MKPPNDSPLEIDLLISEDQRRLEAATSNVIRPLPASNAEELARDLRKTAWPDNIRQRCIRLIQSQAGGSEGLRAFMSAPQPDMDDLTGGELLQNRPDELLAALEKRARDFDEIDELIDDMIVVDPYAGDPPSRRSDKEIGRVLSILDSLEDGKGNE